MVTATLLAVAAACACSEAVLSRFSQGEDSWEAVIGTMAEAGSPVGGSGVARESRRRRKTVWQAWQEQALLSTFKKKRYLSFKERKELAKRMGVSDCRIRVWFQNRRNRSGEEGHASKRSIRGSRRLASPQLQEELGSRPQGRGMRSSGRRPRTRLTSLQLRILGQAFERNPRPGFATREELARDTGLPEDTIHIWFQNRRARRRHRRGRPTAQDQDLLASQGSDGAPAGPEGREREGAQENLLPQEEAGSTGMDTSSPSDLPSFCGESQPFQVAQPRGAGQQEAPTRAGNAGSLEPLLDQLLDEVQVEEPAPAPLNLDGDPGGRVHEGSQESFRPQEEAGSTGMDTSSPSDSNSFCRESQPSQVAQPCGAGQEDARTQADSTGPLELLLLDQLLDEVQKEEHVPAPLDWGRNPGSMEHEGSQDSLLPLEEAANSGRDTSIPSIWPAFCRKSQPPQVAQPSGPGQAQAPTQGGNTDPLELFLYQLLDEVQVEEHAPAPLNWDVDPGGRVHEGSWESFWPQEEAGSTGLDTSSPSDSNSFCRESQPSQVAQPCGAGQEDARTQADSTGPLELLLLDQLLDEVQKEEHVPAPLDWGRNPGSMEHEGSQDSLLPLEEAANSGRDTSIPSIWPAFCRKSQPPQVAQPSGPGQAQAPIQGGNTDPLELFLDQLLTEVQLEEQGPAPVNVEETWEQMDTTPDLPLTSEEYQTLLDML